MDETELTDEPRDAVLPDASVQRFILRVVQGPDAGREWTSSEDRCAIGVHSTNDLVVGDRKVSRFHCEVLTVQTGMRLRDLQSKNGTYLDGIRVQDAWLRDGSMIRVGDTAIELRLAHDPNRLVLSPKARFGSLIGSSVAMRAVFAQLEQAATTDLTVLIEGETGTGKEEAAQSIHDASHRKDGPFVVIDCGALPPTLLDSELFGHEKGAFTGAVSRQIGAFEAAHGGTLFIDEIGELRLDLQPKLLRVLEQRTFRRVGGAHTKKVDIRVVAATHRDLEREVHAGRFRSDLFFRLSVIHIVIPPLRERRDDIPWIVRKVLADPRLAPRLGSEPKAMGDRTVTDAAMHRLLAYDWPGNVRELQNVVHQMVALSDGARVDVEHLPPRLAASVADGRATTMALGLADATSFKDARDGVLAAFEKEFLSSLLRRSKGNISEAARQCGLHRKTVERLVREHGIDVHAIVRQKGDDE